MAQNRYIDAHAVPRPTGAPRQDAENQYRYLFNMVAELAARLETIERRLNKKSQV